ncbi:MAG: hypothetical protein ABI855_01465 [Bacteroidota bacterium]
MQSYINHLLEDITKAQRAELSIAEIVATFPKTFEEEMEEIERWVEHEPMHTFSYYCGLQKEQFPPAEKLNKKQLQQIIKAFNHLLFTWNLSADIPEAIPLNKNYSLLISVLDEKTDIVNSGFMTFEFCNYDPPSCPFGEYCNCKKFENDVDSNMNVDIPEGDLPF